jgi:hypothetical protein
MSKVSDALRRASEEGEKKIARAFVEEEQRDGDAENGNSNDSEDVDSTAVEYSASGGTLVTVRPTVIYARKRPSRREFQPFPMRR